MTINLNRKEISWIANSMYVKSRYYILWRFFETLLLDPTSDTHTKTDCLNYFFDFASYQGYGLDKETRKKMSLKVLAEAITSPNTNQEVTDKALYYIKQLADITYPPVTKDNDFLEMLHHDFLEEMCQILISQKSNWYDQEACLNFFINESYKDLDTVISTLEDLILNMEISDELRSYIASTQKFINEIHSE